MARTKLLAVTSNVIVEQSRNSASLIELIEEFASPAFPILIPTMYVFWLVEKGEDDGEEIDGAVAFYLNGVQIEGQRYPVHLNFQGKERVRQLLVLGGYLVTGPGVLRVACFLGDQAAGEYTINIKAVPAQQADAAAV